MLDRASTFADPEIIALLKERFVPVAIDQWYTRRQQDATGEFWRQIAGQGPRSDFSRTTQGLYLADPAGKLIAYNNNRGPERIRKLLGEAAEGYQPPGDASPLVDDKPDPRFTPVLPEGAVVIRVSARVEGGYPATDDPWQKIFQQAVSRDNLWVTADELKALAGGEFPAALVRRIARFHLVDNTRGEAPAWDADEIREASLRVDEGRISGRVRLATADGQRTFDAELKGAVTFGGEGRLRAFELLAEGDFSGAGPFTRDPPPGKFPLTVAFQLADGTDPADALPPHGSRGWVEGYLASGD